jgi:ribosomal-protein-serine acetyltransferase
VFRFQIDHDTELRLLEERHAEELFALTNESRMYLREWLPWLDNNTSLEDTKGFIRSSLKQFAKNNGFQLGIWFQGKLVGVIGYHSIEWVNRTTSIGYWLGEPFQRRGLATKACQSLTDYAFRGLRLNRVEIRCATGNNRSRNIPKRLGFKEEGIVRQVEWLYDHFVDHVIYGMVSGEYPTVVEQPS